jgi:hypothetical protein
MELRHRPDVDLTHHLVTRKPSGIRLVASMTALMSQ